MTVALITDIHLDGRKGSLVFWEYFQKFYDDIFFPTLQKQNIKTIINLGDTFDNRKGIDFNVWNRIRRHYFDRIRELGITLHMITGNHDVYYKNTNDVNSPELLLSDYNNIIIYSKPTTVNIEGTDICMLPWINTENRQECLDHLEDTPAKIVMGHLELAGFEVSPGMVHEGGMNPDTFTKFKQVFSGHFHHKSKKGNITYLGNPYQMFWSDYKDPRGFHLYEPSSNKLRFVKNPYEIFQKIYYDDADSNFSINPSDYSNSYVKIIVNNKSDYFKFEKMIESLYDAGIHDLKIVENLVEKDTIEYTDTDLEIKDTLSLLNEYIDEVDMSVNKNNLKQIMRSLYIESCEVV
jgi:DNA repair exonuclease SbcCD nuclease subunit